MSRWRERRSGARSAVAGGGRGDGEGNSGSATHTERAIAYFRPPALFFVGVAGSLRAEVALEDVVVAGKTWVSGDVVLNSRTSPLADLIDRSHNDAVAIDMESAGMAQAARLSDIPVLAVRGISDFADGREAVADAKGTQPVAARNAASVAVKILRELPAPGPVPSRPA